MEYNKEPYEVEYYMRRYNKFYFRNDDNRISITVNDDVKELLTSKYSYGDELIIEYSRED